MLPFFAVRILPEDGPRVICSPGLWVVRVCEDFGTLRIGGSDRHKPADGSHILPNTIGKGSQTRCIASGGRVSFGLAAATPSLKEV